VSCITGAGSTVRRTRERSALRSHPWCADYSAGNGGCGTNCGFLTIEQFKATVSGMGGVCVPNQSYNPGPTGRTRSSRHHWRSILAAIGRVHSKGLLGARAQEPARSSLSRRSCKRARNRSQAFPGSLFRNRSHPRPAKTTRRPYRKRF
jgi:hypothetical protein